MTASSFPRWATATWLNSSSDSSQGSSSAITVMERPARPALAQPPALGNPPSSDWQAEHRSISSSDWRDCLVACRVPISDLRLSTTQSSEPEDHDMASCGQVGIEFGTNWSPTVTEDETFEEDATKLVACSSAAAGGGGGGFGGGDSLGGAFPVWQRHPIVVTNSSNTADQQTSTTSSSSAAAAAAKEEEAIKDADAVEKLTASTVVTSDDAAASAATVRQAPEPAQPQSTGTARSGGGGCCCSEFSPTHCLCLSAYYLCLWVATVLFTWALLELSLAVTSRGPLPYYGSAHSFCLSSPRLGFAGCNPEPGRVTEFADLAGLQASLEAGLAEGGGGGGGSGLRSCDPASPDTSEAELMKPCNLTLYSAAMLATLRSVLKDRPAVLLQMKRHLGYLPVSGATVQIGCTVGIVSGGASLPLKYYSWVGGAIVDSNSSGSVPTDYFPLMTARHAAPGVLVAMDTAARADWLNRQLTLRCRPSDGGEERPEREVLLLVKG